jgi:hypothetical protein
MKSWIKNTWFYWWFVTTQQCKHIPSPWIKKDLGMGRFKCCTNCGKVLEIQ